MKTDKINISLGYLGLVLPAIFGYLCLLIYFDFWVRIWVLMVFLMPFIIIFLIKLIWGEQ